MRAAIEQRKQVGLRFLGHAKHQRPPGRRHFGRMADGVEQHFPDAGAILRTRISAAGEVALYQRIGCCAAFAGGVDHRVEDLDRGLHTGWITHQRVG